MKSVGFFLSKAWIYGDPHFTTLDGLDYTFNGHGEYILIKDVNQTFQIQCRTDRAITANGSASDATIFTAFAISTPGVWLQAELNDDKDGINLFVGRNNTSWSDLTSDFMTGEFQSWDIENLMMARANNTLTAVFSETGEAAV